MDPQLIKNGLQLYYRILKAHRFYLSGSIRKLGDMYVKQEFRQHHTNPSPHYYPKFYQQWQEYCKKLEKGGLKQVAKPLNPTTQTLLNPQQKKALQDLAQGVKKIKN